MARHRSAQESWRVIHKPCGACSPMWYFPSVRRLSVETRLSLGHHLLDVAWSGLHAFTSALVTYLAPRVPNCAGGSVVCVAAGRWSVCFRRAWFGGRQVCFGHRLCLCQFLLCCNCCSSVPLTLPSCTRRPRSKYLH